MMDGSHKGLNQFKTPDKVNTTPLLRDLYQHVTPQYAVDWKVIGTLLGLRNGTLDIIELDNHYKTRPCCNAMLRRWLEMDTTASWSKLFTVIESPALSCSAPDKVTSEAAAVTAPSIHTGTDSNILNTKPEMFDLMQIVIPKIMNEWEYIAEALRYDLATIKAIEHKEQGDPKKCCRELFKNWLTTNNGAKAGSKVWSTLIDTLKKVNDISDDIVEEIIAQVIQLK